MLDLTLPDMSGLEVAKELREWYEGPIVVLSVRDGDDDKIAALDLGADDYLTKPFSAGELLARIRALLRRIQGGEASLREITSAACTSTCAKRIVTVDGEPVHLTRTEFDILALLARNADRVVTSRMLLEHVWGPEYESDTQTLRVHMSHLRHKIEPPGGVPRYVLTEPGVGFRFVGTRVAGRFRLAPRERSSRILHADPAALHAHATAPRVRCSNAADSARTVGYRGAREQWATSSSTASCSCSWVCACCTCAPPTSCRGKGTEVAEYVVVGLIAVGILVYLGYALLFPEKF